MRSFDSGRCCPGSAYNEEEAEVIYRFEKMSQEWLEERLARVEALISAKRETN